MKWRKGHIITSIVSFVVPLLLTLIYFYVDSNKQLQFFLHSEKINLAGVSKDYNFEEDPENYITINLEDKLITVIHDDFTYNDLSISGILIANLEEEYLIQGKHYEISEEGTFILIKYSNKLKESLTESKVLIGLSVIITITTLVIATYMILRKMDVLKRYRRFSVMISLYMATLIMLVFSMITTQMFIAFGAVSLSWTIYTFSWVRYRKQNNLPLYEDQRVRVVIDNDNP